MLASFLFDNPNWVLICKLGAENDKIRHILTALNHRLMRRDFIVHFPGMGFSEIMQASIG